MGKRLDSTAFKVVKFLFDKEEIVITRSDIFDETGGQNKIVKILVWGYPNGGRGNHIQNILGKIDDLSKMLSEFENKNLCRDEAKELIHDLNEIEGMGPSTWSKLLHFSKYQWNRTIARFLTQKLKNH